MDLIIKKYSIARHFRFRSILVLRTFEAELSVEEEPFQYLAECRVETAGKKTKTVLINLQTKSQSVLLMSNGRLEPSNHLV